MKKKYRLKKSAIAILVSFFLFIVLLIVLFNIIKQNSYSVEYSFFEYDISENFDSEANTYYFEIINDNRTYSFIHESKFLKEKKLISDIKEYEDENYTCLVIVSNYFNPSPLCSYKDTLISHHLVSNSLKEKLTDYIKKPNILNEEYKNYKIYSNKDQLFIWSYKGFNYMNKDKIEFIELFNEDIYEIPLATQINDYIVIPDYESKYSFKKLYLINTETLEVEEWKLNYEITFDSYILGTNDKSIYLVDKKNKKEYEIVPHKKKMRLVGTNNKQGITYNKGHSEKISMKKLTSSENKFNYDLKYNYFLKDNNLYLSYLNKEYKIKLSELKEDIKKLGVSL